MEIIIVLILLVIIFFVANVLLKPKNIPKEYIDPAEKGIRKVPQSKNYTHNIPEKFFQDDYFVKDYSYGEEKRRKTPRKKAVPKKKVELEGEFEISEAKVPEYAVINFDTESSPGSYNNSFRDYDLWPDITKLAYYVFDDKAKLMYSKHFDFLESEIESIHKYDEFLKDMRSVKVLVSHNMSYKVKALKADFLKNGYKLSLFKRDEICLMESSAPVVGIDTGHKDFKWPTFSEMIVTLFYPNESIEDFEPEDMGDFEWDTKALAKTFVKLS